MARIITLAHQKGGVGKSTLALNLAYCFQIGLKVGLVDADLQGSLRSLQLMVDGINLIDVIDDFSNLKSQPFDVILVDTPPYLSNRLPELFLQSDFILVPTKAGFFDMMAIKSTLALIQDTMKDRPDLKAGIVFNMIKGRSSITSEIRSLTKDFTIPVLQSMISDRVSFTRSAISGGVLQTADEKAKTEMIELTEEILSLLGL